MRKKIQVETTKKLDMKYFTVGLLAIYAFMTTLVIANLLNGKKNVKVEQKTEQVEYFTSATGIKIFVANKVTSNDVYYYEENARGTNYISQKFDGVVGLENCCDVDWYVWSPFEETAKQYEHLRDAINANKKIKKQVKEWEDKCDKKRLEKYVTYTVVGRGSSDAKWKTYKVHPEVGGGTEQ